MLDWEHGRAMVGGGLEVCLTCWLFPRQGAPSEGRAARGTLVLASERFGGRARGRGGRPSATDTAAEGVGAGERVHRAGGAAQTTPPPHALWSIQPRLGGGCP